MVPIRYIGNLFTVFALVAAFCLIGLVFHNLFDLFSLGKWLTHVMTIQFTIIVAIVAFYMSMTKHERTAIGLWVLAVLAAIVTVGIWSTGH